MGKPVDGAVVIDIHQRTLADKRTVAKYLRGELTPTARNATLRARLASAARELGVSIASAADGAPAGADRAVA